MGYSESLKIGSINCRNFQPVTCYLTTPNSLLSVIERKLSWNTFDKHQPQRKKVYSIYLTLKIYKKSWFFTLSSIFENCLWIRFVCLFVQTRTRITQVLTRWFSWKWYRLIIFSTSCLISNIKCVTLTVHLQGC